MKSGSADLIAAKRREKIVEAVRARQKNSKEKRISLRKLAEKLGCSLSAVRCASKKASKKVAVSVEKVKVVKALGTRTPAKDTAAKLSKELGIKHIPGRSVRRMRETVRAAVRQDRHARRVANFLTPEQLRNARPPENLEYQARAQGWG